MELCKKYNMYVILRAGPYICGEWEHGGFPYWLTRAGVPEIRKADPLYMKHVGEWFDNLLPRLKKHMYINGGNILHVQIENEYGHLPFGDKVYLKFLADKVKEHLGKETVLFTCDVAEYGRLERGSLPNEALVTVDSVGNPYDAAELARSFNGGKGPFVDSEFYTGWIDTWGDPHHKNDGKYIADCLDGLLAANASVGIYMFFGGTNFGFTSGGQGDHDFYKAEFTSYDYDAPLSEAGDMTWKYQCIREVIKKYHPEFIQNYDVSNTTKASYGKINLTQGITLWDALPYVADREVRSEYPLTFEDIRNPYGFILYTKELKQDGYFHVNSMHDRGHVLVDHIGLDIISRFDERDIYCPKGELSILLENLGRINTPIDFLDTKGIANNATFNNEIMKFWTQYPISMEKVQNIPFKNELPLKIPTFYKAFFNVNEKHDTFLNPRGLKHGVAFINGFNLGRYWNIGSQVTLYITKQFLRIGENEITIFEFDGIDGIPQLSLDDIPILDY